MRNTEHSRKGFNMNLEDQRAEMEAKLEQLGYTPLQIQEHLESCPAFNPAAALEKRYEDIATGEIASISWPWENLTWNSQALIPGAVVIFAGCPGASKSLGVLQCLTYWLGLGAQSSVLMMEGKRVEHVQRLLAQLDTDPNLCNWEWLKVNPKDASLALDRHRARIRDIGLRIHEAGNKVSTYLDVLNWIQARCWAKDRLMVIDPITSADPEGKQWEADRMIVTQAKRMADEFKCSIVMVSHPIKGYEKPSLSSLAGGTAYQRHADAVLWLEAIDDKELTVQGPCGRTQIECNRVMHLLKVRNGPGDGKRIGFRFDVPSFALAEQGLILKDEKGCGHAND